MYIVVGLGNPGNKYEGTRHNIGFCVIDMLSQAHGINVNRIKHKALVGEGFIGGEKVLLVKPQTFMNLSGQSLLDIRNWYKLDDDRMIIIYDDIDLNPGVLRIRPSGSGGTHNGMRSIIYHLQTEAFPRIRIGVGKPPDGWELADFVLSRFREEEVDAMIDSCKRAVKGVELIISRGVREAMNQCNG